MGGGGSSAPSSQTVTQSQQIPQFEQNYAQNNQNIAASLAAQPYPQYQGQIVAPETPTQQAGQQAAINTAGSYAPDLAGAEQATLGALGPNQATQAGANTIAAATQPNTYTQAGAGQIAGSTGFNPVTAAGVNTISGAFGNNPANPGVIQSYMSPFVQAALQPQITALNTQLGQQQMQTNAQATQAGAFGDARQGAENALNNFYGNQSLSGLLGQGYNTAYSNALQTATTEQGLQQQAGQALGTIGLGQGQLGLSGGQALGNLGISQGQLGVSGGQALANTGLNQSAQQLQGGAQLGQLAGLNQSLGLQGANAIYDVGQQQQQNAQQALNAAYQQYQNQVQWPYQNLNVMESALSNSPYNMVNQLTVPGANPLASNLGTFAGLAGLLGGASGQSSSAAAPFGGAAYNASSATA